MIYLYVIYLTVQSKPIRTPVEKKTTGLADSHIQTHTHTHTNGHTQGLTRSTAQHGGARW